MYRELLGAYALDAVTRDEQIALETHLEECDSCRSEVATLRAAVSAIPLTVDEMEPSLSLRASILSAVEREPNIQRVRGVESPPAPPQVVSLDEGRSRRQWLPWAAAAALLALSIGLLGWNFSLRDTDEPGRWTIALAPTSDAITASAEATYVEGDNVVLMAMSDMPPLEPDQVYQVWLIDDAGPVSAGVFAASQTEFAFAAHPEELDRIAITAEPGPVGVAAPTSEPILTGQFGQG
jgi:anti-sigma-K factor RskA